MKKIKRKEERFYHFPLITESHSISHSCLTSQPVIPPWADSKLQFPPSRSRKVSRSLFILVQNIRHTHPCRCKVWAKQIRELMQHPKISTSNFHFSTTKNSFIRSSIKKSDNEKYSQNISIKSITHSAKKYIVDAMRSSRSLPLGTRSTWNI